MKNKKEELSHLLPLDAEALSRNETETATFSMGCFWGPDALFGGIDAVVRTRVGYAGGEKENPTYRSLGRHIETVQVEYDAAEVNYEDLLDVFWTNHSPRTNHKRQYASAVFYHDEEQKEAVRESRDRFEEKANVETDTIIEEYDGFHLAEDYHQKYNLQQNPTLVDEFEGYDEEEFVDSTVAARLNAYVSGKRNEENLEEDLAEFGLSPEGTSELKRVVEGRVRGTR